MSLPGLLYEAVMEAGSRNQSSPAFRTGAKLARGTILNLLGQGVPILIGLVTIPLIIRGLGAERFGLLGLSWAILGTFTLFNFGLGRATTKFFAEYVGRGEVALLPAVFWTALWLQLLLGLLGGLVLVALSPILLERVFRITPNLTNDARGVLLILSAGLPIVFGAVGLRGVLEASQRFDLVNLVKLPLGASSFVIPAVGVTMGVGLPGIVCLLVAMWLAAGILSLALCFRLFPRLRDDRSPRLKVIRPLMAYGGWLTVSNLIAPVFLYLDRFLIGSALTIAAVGYYTAPFEVATKLWIVPISVATTLFPTFSALRAEELQSNIDRLYARSVKHLLLLLGPMVALLVVFGEEFLSLWLGTTFAEASSVVLQVLAVGVLVNSVAWVPYSLLQGRGQPHVTAKFHVLELCVYPPLAWILIKEFGIVGAAIAWMTRATLDAALLFWACRRLKLISRGAFGGSNLARGIVAVLALTGILSLIRVGLGGPARVGAVVVALLGFVVFVWRFLLSPQEKQIVSTALSMTRTV